MFNFGRGSNISIGSCHGQVVINGKRINVPDGANISMRGDKVYVNGQLYDEENFEGAKEIKIEIQGSCGDITTSGSVIVNGNAGNIDAGTHVECGNVSGHVDAGTSIKCKDIYGNADAGTSIKCDKIGGRANAGVSVEHRG